MQERKEETNDEQKERGEGDIDFPLRTKSLPTSPTHPRCYDACRHVLRFRPRIHQTTAKSPAVGSKTGLFTDHG